MASHCGHFRILNISLNSLLSLFIFAACLPSLHIMVRHHRNNRKFSRPLFYAQCAFYVMCIVYSLVRIPDLIFECYTAATALPSASSLLFVFYPLSILSYAGHWTSLLLILYLRLVLIFQETEQETSRCFQRVSLSLIVAIAALFIAVAVVVTMQSAPVNDFHLLLIMAFVLLLLTHLLMLAFIRKLYVLNRHTFGLEASATNTLNLVGLMTKYTILTAVSIASTTVSVVAVLGVALVSGYLSDESFLLATTATTANVLIDVVCLALSFKFHQKHYACCCSWMDAKCRACCLWLTRNGIDDAAQQLAQQMHVQHVAQGSNSSPALGSASAGVDVEAEVGVDVTATEADAAPVAVAATATTDDAELTIAT